MSDQKHTDLTFLRTFSGNNEDRVKKYVQMFINAIPDQFRELKEAGENADWRKARSVAHSIKPLANYMGANELKDILLFIEINAAEETNLDELPSKINSGYDLMEKVVEELKLA